MSPGHAERLDAALTMAQRAIDGGLPFDEGVAGLAIPEDAWASVPRIVPESTDARAALLGLTAAWHAHIGDPAKGAGCACALYGHWRRRIAEEGLAFIRALGLADAAAWMVAGMIRLGMLDDAIAFARSGHATLSEARFPAAAENLRVLLAEACLEANRADDARDLLPSAEMIDSAGNAQAEAWGRPAPVEHVEARRMTVSTGLDRLFEAGVAARQPAIVEWARELDEMADMLEALRFRDGVDHTRLTTLAERARDLARRRGMNRADLLNVTAALTAEFVEATRAAAPGLQHVDLRLHEIAVAMASDPAFLGAEGDLDWLALYAQSGGEGPGGSWRQSCLWTASVLFERQGRWQHARETLEDLRRSLDEARSAVSDPRVRAGLASSYPELAARLASMTLRAGVGAEQVLAVIEWANARWLAEDLSIARPEIGSLREAVRSTRCHYLTMTLGEASTCLALMTSDGNVLAREVAVGRAAAEIAVSRLYRDGFETGGSCNWREPVDALLSWLPAPGESSPFGEEDVLLLAPDSALQALPLHALPCADGAPLAPRMAVVRTHGAALIAGTLRADPERPRGFVALRASTAREEADARRTASFERIVDSLRHALGDGQVLDGSAADRTNLVAAIRPSFLVHLWAHGDALPGVQFYRSSGILLADRGILPSRGTAAFASAHLLSPERVLALDSQGHWTGSHVTIQACVSTSARANAQGDAIGLEWAFLRAGVSSVLACHWHVSYRAAAAFSTAFYEHWLDGEASTSRAEAWRRAVVDMSARSDLPDGSWAAMTLTGDWR